MLGTFAADLECMERVVSSIARRHASVIQRISRRRRRSNCGNEYIWQNRRRLDLITPRRPPTTNSSLYMPRHAHRHRKEVTKPTRLYWHKSSSSAITKTPQCEQLLCCVC